MDTKLKELPVEERLILVEELWDSIAADHHELPLTDAQKKELDRRLDAYEKNPDGGRLAEDVLTEIRQKLCVNTLFPTHCHEENEKGYAHA